MKILSESSNEIQNNLALSIHNKLEQGASLHESFDYLDEQLRYTLSIEDFERKIDDRLERYLYILEKQIRFNLKRYATIFSVFVYSHIGLMVVLVYSTLLYPLQLLEQVL
jgi:type II secretory pathway component PulF